MSAKDASEVERLRQRVAALEAGLVICAQALRPGVPFGDPRRSAARAAVMELLDEEARRGRAS